jgi:DNA-binding MarR family transcriptional regulator
LPSLYHSECYCTNLRRGAGTVTEFYDRFFADVGLSAAQYYLLINLSRMGEANAAQWARRVGLERSTLVRNVRLLVQKGWVGEGGPGRGHRYTLTPAGRDLLEQAVPRWQAAQQALKEVLGEADAAALLRICGRLQDWKEEV